MLEICLPSNIEYLPLIDTVCQAFCGWAAIGEEATDEVSMAVIEAATNAMVHGNASETSKRIRAVFQRAPCEIIITVDDEGPGFDPGKIPNPVDAENLLKESGRGVYIMRQVMDDVQFGPGPDGGTRVRLVKRLKMPEQGRFLCVDYGEKRLGLALSDELGITAQPLAVIEEQDEGRQIAEIEKIAVANEVRAIIVGLPLTLSGEVSGAASRVIAFARNLNKRTGICIHTWDERLSTKQGERLLIEAGMSRQKRKGVVDSIAASIVLQSYLDARRKK
jgi:putative Holliday junction resolvase